MYCSSPFADLIAFDSTEQATAGTLDYTSTGQHGASDFTAVATDCVAISVRSARHHLHVHFPPLLAGVINRNPRNDEGREQEQRDGALSPSLHGWHCSDCLEEATPSQRPCHRSAIT